ncbi:hypothetical protein [Nonomuraea dietziae]|uniref:hypothetical protein n=1 Tax=Nonomuraea dietziae TaxID=65515 RepID=UPI0033F39545
MKAVDPNATLAEIRIMLAFLKEPDLTEDEICMTVLDLTDRIEGLDHWLTIGGFLPVAWAGPRLHVAPMTTLN